ncbi:MAG TPA: permease-like cell division protein FtsX [Burkholderiaceae bacterium]|nr:permease-like cell division protein FtsX [Burkholderiaceae bacterium]HYA76312.1 permease-like cell division protein FtsX [Burkholderiaceae bacterium]
MSYTTSHVSALREALRRTLGRPIEFGLVVASSATMLAALALIALTLWRALPLEQPQWMRPQALVLAAGAQGEIDLAAVQTALRRVAIVASADFLARDAALAELAQRKSLFAIGLTDLRPNPLPDAFLVRFVPGAAPEAVESAVAEMRKVKNVESVEYQPELYRRISLLSQLAGRICLLLAAPLGAALIIGVSLAASLWIRIDQDEVQVLNLLGADPSIMRRPYVYAGAVSLLLAAALAWWMVVEASAWLEPLIGTAAQQYALRWAPAELPIWAGALFCLGAALLGALLGWLAARLAIGR